MNIIFLDIDGVLNSDLWYQQQAPLTRESNQLEVHLDPHAISLLNKIILKTNAAIVLSSTWRRYYPINAIQTIFEQQGFKGKFIDSTPDLTSKDSSFVRGNEILKWCKDNEAVIGKPYHQFKSYAILDDKNDMLYWQRHNFFQTDRYCGLTPSKASEIIRFFTP